MFSRSSVCCALLRFSEHNSPDGVWLPGVTYEKRRVRVRVRVGFRGTGTAVLMFSGTQ